MTRILVLGAGNVGKAVGLRWLQKGHDVRFGVPDPSKPKYGDLPHDRLQPADKLGDAQVVVVTTPDAAATQAVAALGDLTGRIVIDCTNAIGRGAGGMTWAPPPKDRLPSRSPRRQRERQCSRASTIRVQRTWSTPTPSRSAR